MLGHRLVPLGTSQASQYLQAVANSNCSPGVSERRKPQGTALPLRRAECGDRPWGKAAPS